MRKLTNAEFIYKANKVHNNRYDYTEAEYLGTYPKVNIICSKHGRFQQSPTSHLSGSGCTVCGYKKVTENQTDDLNSFITKAELVHKKTYDYSKVEYKSSATKVTIICKEHGEFTQKPYKHVAGQGCRKCGYDRMRGASKNLHKELKRLKTAVSAMYYRKRYTKYSRIYDIIGCDWDTFENFLNDNEFGFKVGDAGVDLDHIVPISWAKNIEELHKMSHYTNFQLLPEYYNRYIKKTKEFNINELRGWIAINTSKITN